MQQDRTSCGRRYFRNHDEFLRWFEIRSAGFGDWYTPPPPRRWKLSGGRHMENCIAAVFPEFLHELRDETGKPIGYLATVPGYWNGDVNSLHTYEYIDETFQFRHWKMMALTAWYVLTTEWLRLPRLFDPVVRRLRASRMRGANAIFLLAILIDPEYRKHGLTQRLIGHAKEAGRQLGYEYVVAPFRPNAYGDFKLARKAAHSDELFAQYSRMTDAQGRLIDPWLRAVVRMGGQLYRPVPHSFAVRGSIERFERFRQEFRRDDWYSPAHDVWECGETCTWYVDRARGEVLAVESNVWGAFRLGPQAAAVPSASSMEAALASASA